MLVPATDLTPFNLILFGMISLLAGCYAKIRIEHACRHVVLGGAHDDSALMTAPKVELDESAPALSVSTRMAEMSDACQQRDKDSVAAGLTVRTAKLGFVQSFQFRDNRSQKNKSHSREK